MWWRSGENRLKKRETTCGASEQLEVANMGIKMILYGVLPPEKKMPYQYSNNYKVDTGSTSGFVQKTFSGFSSIRKHEILALKSLFYRFLGSLKPNLT